MRKPLRHHLRDYFLPHARNGHFPHLFSIASVAIIAIIIIACEVGSLVQVKLVFTRTNYLASILPATLVELTNQDRAVTGLASVTEDALLDKAAQAAAEDMASRGYFSHISPEGKDPWYWLDSVGYAYSYAGQNLAVNFTDSKNVETAWMASPTHRANIEKPQYTRVGFGTANGMYEGRETTFVVSFFATPLAAPAAGAAPAASVAVQPPRNGEVRLVQNVLGAETVETTFPAEPEWFDPFLVSPTTTLETILTALLAVISISYIASFFIRGRESHPQMHLGWVFLIILIATTLVLNATFSGPITIL
jgi:hypothetical protein